MEDVRMSKKEIRYSEVISHVVVGEMRQKQASEILGLSLRQVKRLCKRFRADGIAGLIHRNRGRSSNNKILEHKKTTILGLIKEHYRDFGPQLIHEQLIETHDITVSSEWIRLLMIEKGLWKPKKVRNVAIHQRRPRRERTGELIQVDGSYHKWFEDRGPKCCLLVAIDDATSELCELQFVDHETTADYMNLMKKYIKRRGLPVALYSDRLNVFRGKNCQFKRSLEDIDIALINANTPQAKGRVERANGTLQDRLIKLMRLKNISTMKEGNEYLEEYMVSHNERFSRSANNLETAHREFSEDIRLDLIFCVKEKRKVSKDHTVHFMNRTYSLDSSGEKHRLRGKTALVSNISGKVHIEIEGKEYSYKIYEEQPFQYDPMNRKEVDNFLDKKRPMTSIERSRKGIRVPN